MIDRWTILAAFVLGFFIFLAADALVIGRLFAWVALIIGVLLSEAVLRYGEARIRDD